MFPPAVGAAAGVGETAAAGIDGRAAAAGGLPEAARPRSSPGGGGGLEGIVGVEVPGGAVALVLRESAVDRTRSSSRCWRRDLGVRGVIPAARVAGKVVWLPVVLPLPLWPARITLTPRPSIPSPGCGGELKGIVGGVVGGRSGAFLSLCVPVEMQPDAGETPTLQVAPPLPEKELLLEVTRVSLPLPLGIHWPLPPTLPPVV